MKKVKITKLAEKYPTLLIDGDIYLYTAACAVEREVDFDGLTVLYSDKDEIYHVFNQSINRFKYLFNTKEVLIVFSDSGNFRKDVLPEYKAHRKKVRKPIALQKAREMIEATYKCVSKPNLEADDVIGILATGDQKQVPINGTKVIISIDKDFQSIPGYFFNSNKETEYVYDISELEADKFFYKQVLMGDSADNYKGCPGIGEVKANKIIDNDEDMWYSIISEFEKKGLTEDDALVQARCARILRATDYNFKTNKVILWKNE